MTHIAIGIQSNRTIYYEPWFLVWNCFRNVRTFQFYTYLDEHQTKLQRLLKYLIEINWNDHTYSANVISGRVRSVWFWQNSVLRFIKVYYYSGAELITNNACTKKKIISFTRFWIAVSYATLLMGSLVIHCIIYV